MDIANKWADGEDAFHNKRARSPEEDRFRRSNDRKRRYRNYDDYDGPSQVAAGFPSNENRKDEYRSSGYRSSTRDAPRPSKPAYMPIPPRDFDQSPDQILNRPCNMHFMLTQKEGGDLTIS